MTTAKTTKCNDSEYSGNIDDDKMTNPWNVHKHQQIELHNMWIYDDDDRIIFYAFMHFMQ